MISTRRHPAFRTSKEIGRVAPRRQARLPEAPVRNGPVRWCLLTLGVLAAALGAVGAFLPVLPTTPFMLLAAACFARSSPSLHRRTLESRVVGPYLSQWQRDRTVPRAAKRKALGLVVISFALSITMADGLWLQASLGAGGIALLTFLAWLPSTRSPCALPQRVGEHAGATGTSDDPDSMALEF